MGLTRRVASGPTDPVREVNNVLELLGHAAGDANVLMEIRNLPSEPIEITSDPALIMHILVNMVLNAIGALRPLEPSLESLKRVWIDIIWATDADTPLPLSIEVCDNGPGVDEGLEARIFEPGITTKKDGHGLGLAIGVMIAGYLGGDLTLVNPRQPTRFRLRLPRRSPKMADLEEELKQSEERP
jgi:signal transduction histidine kinase